MNVGRNELCPCGSGKKYKNCCGKTSNINGYRVLKKQENIKK